MIDYLSLTLVLSLVTNVILFLGLLYFYKKSKEKKLDANAQEMMAELFAGPAVFKIEIIDRGSILQWKGIK